MFKRILMLVCLLPLLLIGVANATTYTQPLYGSYDLVPTADGSANTTARDVLGNKTDAAVGSVGTTSSVTGYVKGILTDTGTTIPGTITTLTSNVATIDNEVAILNASTGAYNSDSVNYLAVTADFTSATWNTAAAHEILTVTGAVKLFIVAECTDSLTGGAGFTIALGSETTTDAFIAATDGTLIDTGEVWDSAVDGTITTVGLASAMGIEGVVANGGDVGYTLATDAATAGSIVFHVWWTPLNATGAVVAGDGSAL